MSPQVQQVHQELGKTVKDLYTQVLQANPGLKKNPQGAYAAVEAMIAQNKEMDDSEKVALRAYSDVAHNQIEAQRIQNDALKAANSLAEKKQADADRKETAMAKINEALTAAKIAASSRQAVAGTNASARMGAAEVGAASREKVGAGHDATSEANAHLAATIKQYGIDAGMSEAEMKAATGEETSNYRAQSSAAAASGKPAPAAPKSRATLKRPLQPSLGNSNVPQGSARNPYKVKTPEEAAQLPPGTHFVGPDGQVRQRPE
jgi:hypothetical protein